MKRILTFNALSIVSTLIVGFALGILWSIGTGTNNQSVTLISNNASSDILDQTLNEHMAWLENNYREKLDTTEFNFDTYLECAHMANGTPGAFSEVCSDYSLKLYFDLNDTINDTPAIYQHVNSLEENHPLSQNISELSQVFRSGEMLDNKQIYQMKSILSEMNTIVEKHRLKVVTIL